MAQRGSGATGLLKRLLRPARPIIAAGVDSVAAPTYARRDELSAATEHMGAVTAEIRRLLADHFEATGEAEELIGRRLGAIAGGIDELQARVDALQSAVEKLTSAMGADR